MLPIIKREAISKILYNRLSNQRIDQNTRREKLLKKIESVVINKNILNQNELLNGDSKTTMRKYKKDGKRKTIKMYSLNPASQSLNYNNNH